MITVEEMMTTGARTLGENDSLADVQAVMDKFSCHHVPIVSEDAALVGLEEPDDVLERDALAGAGASEHHQRLAFVEHQVDATQHVEVAEGLVDASQLDHLKNIQEM